MSRLECDRLLRIAVGHHQAGEFAQAEALYRRILAHDRDHDGALHMLGFLALQSNRHKLAIDSLRRAIFLQPNVPEYYGNLGNALMANGQVEEAVSCYRQLVGRMPHSAEAHAALANALRCQGKLDEAVAYFRRAVALKPGDFGAHSNLGNALMAEGRPEEAAACYRRTIELNPFFAEAHNNLGNTFKDQGKLAEAMECFRRALECDPDDAAAHNNLGNCSMGLGQVDEAIACYHRALTRRPGFAAAHNNLGVAFAEQGKRAEAVVCYAKALAADPTYVEAHLNLGNALKEQGKLDEAMSCYRRALTLAPDCADAHYNVGNALMALGELGEAAASFRRALERTPNHAAAHNNFGIALKNLGETGAAEAHFDEAIRLAPGFDEPYFNRSTILLQRGDFVRGWAEYEQRWKTKEYSAPRRAFAQPRWDGGPLAGRTILLHAEQGLGDALHFIRYVPLVAQAGGNVIVECQPSLKRLLRSSFPRVLIFDSSEPLPRFDVQSPLLSLPLYCRTTMENLPRQVPYIEADENDIAAWRTRFAAEARVADASILKIGLCWAGNKEQANDRNRSMGFRDLTLLGGVPGIRLFSLQKGAAGEQARESPTGMTIVDWTDELHDFADSAAFIANLDLVLSVDTSVAHLAGAMGKPVWTMLCFAPDWRYHLDPDHCPWYPTMRLFRQPAPGDWPSVVARVADALVQNFVLSPGRAEFIAMPPAAG